MLSFSSVQEHAFRSADRVDIYHKNVPPFEYKKKGTQYLYSFREQKKNKKNHKIFALVPHVHAV